MYSTCLFCHGSLGANEAVEHFPVGRRLAFDAAKGRLWVVCGKCGRWNLTPLEERWEALEECERLFRATRLRASTDHMGLARLREGLELVRIGEPQRGEFAAWRYGAQFIRRHRRGTLLVGGVVAGAVGLAIGGPLVGIGLLGGLQAAEVVYHVLSYGHDRRVAVRLASPTGRQLELTPAHVRAARLVPAPSDAGWALDVVHRESPDGATLRLAVGPTTYGMTPTRLEGDLAVRALGLLLPRINRFGGSAREVERAVDTIEEAGGPESVFAAVARDARTRLLAGYEAAVLWHRPTHLTFALEMAANEAAERRAMEGELAELEAEWRRAEEIAAIADDLLLPASVGETIRRWKGR